MPQVLESPCLPQLAGPGCKVKGGSGSPNFGPGVVILSLIFASLPCPGIGMRCFQEAAIGGAHDDDGEGSWRHGGPTEARWLVALGRRGRQCAAARFHFQLGKTVRGGGSVLLSQDLDEGRGGAVVGTTEGTQDGLPHEWSGRRRAPVEDLPWCTPHHP